MTDTTISSRAAARPPRVAVVGAGITGLSAAIRLLDRVPGLSLVVFDSANRPGGVLQTLNRNGYLIERSADSFLTKEPWAVDFCERVGIGDQLLPTDPARRRALVVCRGRVAPAPESFVLMAPKRLRPVIKTPVLSWRGKLRLAAEPLIPRRRGGGDESVASFARRRLGREAFDRLVQPLLAGIYTADPERLSMAATMPQFVEQEAQHGSLLRAAFAQRKEQSAAAAANAESGARYGLFLAPRLGTQQLVDAAAAQLPAGTLRLATRVVGLRRDGERWCIDTQTNSDAGGERFDGVIVTTPLHHAADLLRGDLPELGAALDHIPYAGCSVVCLGVRQDQLAAQPEGFGFVVPAVERRQLIAASFASLKFPGRAPDGRLLVRVFIGGALQPGLGDLPDEELAKIATRELGELIGLRGEAELLEVARWPRGMPQYHVGHLDRVAVIERLVAQQPTLEVAGAGYRGVGVPQCLRDGLQAADRLADTLAIKPI